MAETIKARRDRIAKQTLYEIGYEYLCDNFHKFKESNKIKVSLAVLNIFEKDGSKTQANVILMPVIQKVSAGEAPNINLEFNIGAQIGSASPAEDTGYSRETPSLN